MLTLGAGQVECLWDEVLLPFQARELPENLARLDRVLRDSALLRPVEQAWDCSARGRGRPSISIATFVRLMVIKQRTGWGYETLMREVSDSLHLRRFCLIAIDQRVPEESTVRKLARRLGAEVVQEITRAVISKAQRETRFRARAARIDSTVVEADIRYPSDAMLALQGVRILAREGRKHRLLPQTARELEHADIRLREIVCDGGFQTGPTKDTFPGLTEEQIQIAGHHEPGSRRTRKRRARYRTGIEGASVTSSAATGYAEQG